MNSFIEVIKSGDYVILDTETTGLHDGEIVQIAIIDSSGTPLIDTLVKPIYSIPQDAMRIHGITNEMVKDAPNWATVTQQVQAILTGRNVIVYNAVYDRKMMHKSAEKIGSPAIDWKIISTWYCAMEAFAEVYGDWNDYRQSYRWQKLTTAAAYYNVQIKNAHSALGDCLMTLGVVKAMAAEASE